MKRMMLTLGAMAMAVPMSVALPGTSTVAEAKAKKRYYNNSRYRSCRPSSGTTGLVAGGVGGAVIGSKVIGGGLLGAAAGAVGGALAGRAIDRTITADKRCR